MTTLKDWIAAATNKELNALAHDAGTTVGTLRQIAGAYRKYSVKAGLARRLEIAAENLRKINPELPTLSRTDLCNDCAVCEFAQRLED